MSFFDKINSDAALIASAAINRLFLKYKHAKERSEGLPITIVLS